MSDASLLISAYLAMTGAAVGSFISLVADRLPRGESIVSKRSHCDGCGRVLAWWELVPVGSYLWLRGRCAKCGTHIPARLLAVELGMAFLFVLTGLAYGWSMSTAIVLGFLSLLMIIALIDFDTELIFNKLVLPGTALAIAVAPLMPWAADGAVDAWLRSLGAAAIAFGVLLAVFLASRGGMGAGDVKFAAMIGAMTGIPLVGVALFVGFIVGGVVGSVLLLLRLRGRRDAIPYGPYLALGAAASLLYGAPLWEWYTGFLGL